MDHFLDTETEVMEIDITEILFLIRRKIGLIIISAIMMGCVAFLYTNFLVTPLYTSSSQFLVLTKETTLTSLANLQLSNYLTNDYKELVLSAPVLKEVVENLELDFDYKDLKKKISINNPEDTRILIMTVEDINPERACVIVDELAEVAAEYIGETMEMTPPKIIGTGEVNPIPSSPNIMKNTVLGVFMGIVISMALIVLMAMLDDTIKSEEDIEKYLRISNLASVPDRKDYISGKAPIGKKKYAKNEKKRA